MNLKTWLTNYHFFGHTPSVWKYSQLLQFQRQEIKVDKNYLHCDISFLPKWAGIFIYINLRTFVTKSYDPNAEFRAGCSRQGLLEVIKDEIGVAAAEKHITGTIFICLTLLHWSTINNFKNPAPALFVPLLSGLHHISRCRHRWQKH